MSLVNSGKIDEAKTAREELRTLQGQFDLLADVLDPDGSGQVAEPPQNQTKPVKTKDSTAEFANAARRGFRNATMSEGSNVDGGYTVPEDIQTRVNEYRDAKASLINLVSVESVTTNKGARTFKTRAQQTGFAKVSEGGKITAKDTPQFSRLEWEVSKYAGYLPVTSELLADTDANITQILVSWLGDESRVTRNNIILGVATSKTPETITDLDDIKKILNVTLGQAFKPYSRIVTNDDGLQWLDTLKDSDGKYLLQPNPADPMKMRLCAGATTVPVEVVPNQDMPSDSGVPFLIGDLKEGIKFFDRNLMSIRMSDTAAIGDLNAFEEDLMLFRAIEREDCKLWDSEAFVYALLESTETA